MGKPTNHQWKLVGLLVIPIILALGTRMIYISSPEYAFRRFMAAVREGDIETAKRLSTLRFVAVRKKMAYDPFSLDRILEKEMRHSHNIVWKRPNSTNAVVTHKGIGNAFYRYYLLKTEAGWRIDHVDASPMMQS